MGYPHRRMFRRRRRLPRAAMPMLLAAAVSVFFFRGLSLRMRPLIVTMATSRATNLISLAISQETDSSIADGQIGYRNFVDMELSDSGQVTSLSFRAADGTGFKRTVIERLIARMENLDPDLLSIPLGNLTGVLHLSAVGPRVRVRVQSVGDVSARYVNEFSAAGVNQTRHSVFLEITVTVYLLIPGETVQVSTTEQVCVAETIIVGQVPDTYLNLQNGAE